MTSRAYRVGIIGCGDTGNVHAKAYRRHEHTEIAAAAEPDEGTRASFAERHDVDQTFATYETMLDRVDLDIVSICTWHGTHAQMTVDAAERGVSGIFCEKPMCTSLGEAEAMLDAAERNDVVLTIGHQRRYDPVHEKARQLIDDGVIGEPRVVHAGHRDGLLNWGTHLVDLTRFILGDPSTAWVIGQFERETDRHERGVPIEDRCLGQVCFESGTRLTLEMDLPGPDVGEERIQVYGSNGSLRLSMDAEVTVMNENGTSTYAPEREVTNWFAYLDDMVAVMEGNTDEHRCSARQARYTIEILMSIYDSVRRRSLVSTPLRTRANPLAVMRENGDLEPEYPGEYDIRIPDHNIDSS